MVVNLRIYSYHYDSIQCILAWNGGKTVREWGETASNGGKTDKMLGICTIMLVSMLFSSIPTIYASTLVSFPPLSTTMEMLGLSQMGGIFPPFFIFPPILKW